MPPLSAAQLLAIWEQGWGLTASERTLALLAPACPQSSPQELAGLSIGERDWRLLNLREAAFGSQIVATSSCPNCGERLELTMQVGDLRQGTPPETPREPHSLSVEEYEVGFRLPGTADLAAIAQAADLAGARRSLLRRSLVWALRGGAEYPPDQLPERVLAAVAARMGEIDPQANVQLALDCPGCQQQWEAAFDIASFFWAELDAWGRRLVREIHALASAYGWREADIVAMSPLRRQMYLDQIGT